MGFCAETVWRSYAFCLDSRRTCQSCKGVVEERQCPARKWAGCGRSLCIRRECMYLSSRTSKYGLQQHFLSHVLSLRDHIMNTLCAILVFNSEHQELLKQIQETQDSKVHEHLERELGCLVKQMEIKGEQISKLKKHEATVRIKLSLECLCQGVPGWVFIIRLLGRCSCTSNSFLRSRKNAYS
uniref:Cep57 centrosome microtubule-binding domain-containing protein n=1 Tax=Strigops habroptila TaxID=2489341 RepID=A0A672TFZ4_STRHB